MHNSQSRGGIQTDMLTYSYTYEPKYISSIYICIYRYTNKHFMTPFSE